MYGLSPFFSHMQTKAKKGSLNPSFGKDPSAETIAKLTKLIYVYKATDPVELIGVYPTVEWIKKFKMGKDMINICFQVYLLKVKGLHENLY